VTELLSGDFNAPFGRSSHHQVWSEAMVITPAIRGLLGLEALAGGKELRFEPQLPADWDHVEVRNVAVGNTRYDLNLSRTAGRLTITTKPGASNAAPTTGKIRFTIAPAFPLDARVRAVTVQGRPVKFETSQSGDVQKAPVSFDMGQESVEVIFSYDEGTDVYTEQEIPAPGAMNQGLRVLRSRADIAGLHLVLEGLGGRSYPLFVRGPHQLLDIAGVRVTKGSSNQELVVQFDGPADTYIRRDVSIPFRK
jgi:hypothetical protein